jgi:hypothetical protein
VVDEVVEDTTEDKVATLTFLAYALVTPAGVEGDDSLLAAPIKIVFNQDTLPMVFVG